jgi:hypothetical protein
MRQALISAIAALLLLCASAAAADAPKYQDLVARAEQGDATLDYTALRLSYADADTYDPYAMKTQALFSQAWQAFQAKDCKTALEKIDEFLKVNYVTIPLHFVRSDCLKQAGDDAGAAREEAIGRGLATSLMNSGDGKTPATAYVVVTLSEEGFVETALGFHEAQQALIQDNGHVYDQITGPDEKTGETRSAYFDVGALFAGQARQLGNHSQ